ncbi:MAG TPA: MFS transporter [Thermomicrobiales bacterium]|nr:MFS transporter [Thermomicrobiales bacterium]
MPSPATTTPAKITYRSLFEGPGTATFFIATFLGRIPVAMRGLGVVLLIQLLTGSFSLAGVVGATQTLVAAFASPRLGRFADRYGERTLLIWSAILHVVGMTWLIIAAYLAPNPIMLMIGAALTGASSMPFGSLSRARWVERIGKGRRLEKAYALESMADEMGFIIGPTMVVPLSVSVNAAAGLVVSLLMTILASAILVAQNKPETNVRMAPRSVTTVEGASVVTIPGIQVLMASLLFLGIIFGAVEIVMVAFAEHLNQPNSASIMAAVFAAGSFIGAAIYGGVTWHSPVDKRYKIAIWWMALGTVPILLANTVLAMSLAVFITGLAISPGMIAANTVVEHLSPPKMLTEAFSWLGSAIATGAAGGSIIAGFVLDHIGIRGGQAVGVVGGVLTSLVVLIWAKHLRGERPPETVA